MFIAEMIDAFIAVFLISAAMPTIGMVLFYKLASKMIKQAEEDKPSD